MSWLTEHPVLVWLGVAVVLGAIEVLTLDFFFLALGIAALAGSLVAVFGFGWPVQVVVAVLAAFVTLGLIRPVVIRRMNRRPANLTNAPALVGREVIALTTVTTDSGQVKLAGEVWSARTRRGGPDLAPGERGRVDAIDGATAVVSPEDVPAQDVAPEDQTT